MDATLARKPEGARAPQDRMIEALVFLAVAVVLYWVSDQILLRIEAARGARLESRTLIFFGILLTLALASFWALERLLGP